MTETSIQPDLQALALTKAIRAHESGGNYSASGDVGTSTGAFQFQANTWKTYAKDILGDENAPMSSQNQNAVAYGKIKQWKDAGKGPAEIAAMWNAGEAKVANGTWTENIGVNKINGVDVPYNTPEYAKQVVASFKEIYPQVQQEYAPKSGDNVDLGSSPDLSQSPAVSLSQNGGIIPTFNVNPDNFTAKDIPAGVGATLANVPLGLARGLENAAKVPAAAYNLIKENPVEKQTVKVGDKNIELPIPKNPSQTPLGLFGQGVYETAVKPLIEGVGNILKDIFHGNGQQLKQDVSSDAKAIAKSVIEHPEQIIAMGGTKTGASAIEKTGQVVTQPIKKGIQLTAEKSGAIDAVVNNVANIYRETAGVAKKPTATLNRSMLQGKDPAQFLAENNITPNIENGKMFTKTPQQTAVFNEIAKPYNDAMDAALKEIEPSIPRLKTSDLEADALNQVRTRQYVNDGSIDKRMRDIKNDFKILKREYGDSIKITDVQDIKKARWSAEGKKFDMSRPYQGDTDYIIGNSAMKAIENAVPKDTFSVHGLNKTLGRIYDARKFFQSLDGYTVKGGRLGKYFARTIGATAGAGIGIPGAEIIGALGGDAIMEILQKSTFSNPLKKMILEGLKKTDPAAYTQALEFIKQSQDARASRLGLPESKTIITPAPKVNDTSGIDSAASAANAERINAITRENTPKLPAPKSNPTGKPTIKLPKETQSTIDAREAKLYRSTNQPTNMTAKTMANTDIKPSVYSSKLEVNSSNIAERIKSSEGFDIQKAIKDGDLAKEQVYKPNGKLQSDFAQGRIDDVAQKLDLYKKGLGARYKAMIDANNTTMEDIVKKGLALLKVVDKMSSKIVK